MARPLRGSFPSLLALIPIALAAGCDGTGPESSPAAPSEVSTADRAGQDGKVPAEVVTPNRPIDTKAVVDVVEAEVQGGEAEAGPSREGVLWAFPDLALIEDEPLDIDVPEGLRPLTPVAIVPASNPLTRSKYELGRQLYFDPRVSLDGSVSCATCHDPAKGWTDNLPTSVGIGAQVGARNAPTVINTAYGKTMFWDGRAPSLEAQAQGPIQNSIEMGEQSYEQIIDRLREIPGYRDQFRKVFGTDVTLDGMAKAIATFERVAAISGDSKYDRYAAGDMEALDESEKRGMVLFGLRQHDDDEAKIDVVLQKAKCSACHVGDNFTDEAFHNLGVGWLAEQGKFADPGRWGVSPVGAKDLAELGAFKTPTLRDIEKTFPYMHDGSEATLAAVVDYYDKGGNPNPYLDKEMKPLNLTSQEKADLVAFMKALTGETEPVELPTLPPGPDGTAPDPSAALETPKRKAASAGEPHGILVR